MRDFTQEQEDPSGMKDLQFGYKEGLIVGFEPFRRPNDKSLNKTALIMLGCYELSPCHNQMENHSTKLTGNPMVGQMLQMCNIAKGL